MLKHFSEVLVVGRELSFRVLKGWLKKRGGGGNACFFVTRRSVFISEFKDIRALLISSSSLESSFISTCSSRGGFSMFDTRKYMKTSVFAVSLTLSPDRFLRSAF